MSTEFTNPLLMEIRVAVCELLLAMRPTDRL